MGEGAGGGGSAGEAAEGAEGGAGEGAAGASGNGEGSGAEGGAEIAEGSGEEGVGLVDEEAAALAASEAAAAEAARVAAEAEAAAEAARVEAEAAEAAAEEARLAAEEAAAAEATRVSLLASVKAAAAERSAAQRAATAHHRHLALWLALRAATAAAAAHGAADGAAYAKAARAASEAEANLLPNELAVVKAKVEDARAAFFKERARMDRQLAHFDGKALELQATLESREAHLASVAAAFAAYKGQVARGARHSITSAPIPPAILARYEREEVGVDEAQAKAELRHCAAGEALRAAMSAASADAQSAANSGSLSGGGAGGGSMDIEQLRSENSALVASVEDKERDVKALENKGGNATQVLSHLREKLGKVRAEAEQLGVALGEGEAALARERGVLNAGKKRRDAVTAENTAALRKQGFVFTKAGVPGSGVTLELAVDYEHLTQQVLESREVLYRTQGSPASSPK